MMKTGKEKRRKTRRPVKAVQHAKNKFQKKETQKIEMRKS